MPLSSGSIAGRSTRMLAGCLILSLVQQPVMLVAAAVPGRHSKHAAEAHPLTEEEQATHALNRLTFGPRPGDLERVKAIGVKKWIEMQLNPEQIDDSLLEARLQSFPAMQMSQQALVQAFPSAGVIRAVADGRVPLPSGRVEHAIYQNQLFAYEERREKQAQEAASQPAGEPVAMAANAQPAPATPPAMTAANESVMADAMALEDVASSPSITVHEQKLYADLASTQIVNLSPDQRLERLVSMKPGQLRGFMKGLTPEERSQLTAGMTAQQKETVVALLNPTLLVAGELLQTRLLTDLYSQRQLQAVMTDFG